MLFGLTADVSGIKVWVIPLQPSPLLLTATSAIGTINPAWNLPRLH
jgi:hypothetical protein